ncbi:MAG: TonB-dependent receptor, partial [Gammaproteobacteria bacterium]|nr:TonB-dependent receptor [Gammaproteobacteria bacterium]
GYNTEAAGDDEGRIDGGGVSLNITHETSLADYTSITAFRSTRLEFELDQDQGAAPSPAVQVGTIRSYYDAYSQEFRAGAKPESDIQWTVGLYYLNATTGYNPSEIFLDFTAFGAPATQRTFLYDEQVLNSYAVFGEASFELMPDTNITAGIRYTKDDYDMDYEGKFFDAGKTTRFIDFRVVPPDPTEGEAFTQNSDFSKVTYRAIVDHRFNEDLMTYFSYSRGFRSGGYSLAFPFFNGAPTPVVNPEVLDSFEIGFKSNFMDGNLVINGAAFLYDYENVVIGFVETGGNRNVNAAAAEIKGFELDIIATPFDNGFKLVAGIGVIDGEYTDFPDGPIATPTLIGGNPIGGNTISTGNLTGNDTIRTPDLTLNITPSYTWDTEVGTFTAAVNYYHNSGFAWDVSNRLTEPSYDVLNASLSWTSLNEKLNLRLWGRNLTDKQYAIYSAVSELTDSYAPAAPLTWGVTGTFSF